MISTASGTAFFEAQVVSALDLSASQLNSITTEAVGSYLVSG
jgi:hypothetical protein